jgi:hypothetical protein
MIRDVHPGSRIQGSKRHQIPDPDPQYWIWLVDHIFRLSCTSVDINLIKNQECLSSGRSRALRRGAPAQEQREPNLQGAHGPQMQATRPPLGYAVHLKRTPRD